ncbi:MAG: helix-turn-helix transcriptional regulator [Clostridia bacterium]|nr:helix-turn-helix transcriptional regulator [Clostridia bacterium]
MSANFALRLSDLRKEKNLSQKEAASCLGVSQALLSHYEKGIRECGLEFLKRACDYYDVTSDYLLGLTDSRNGLNDIYDMDILPTDSELKIKTILRALVDMTERLSAAGESSTDKLRDELLLSVYRFALLSVKYGVSDKNWFLLDTRDGDILASHVLDKMFSGKRQNEKSAQSAYDEMPEYLETVIRHSEELLRTRYLKMLEPENE